jgi:putative component of membrane protein insertase Oxa1/YidC/SpoIIIJ protein YidD
MGVTLIEGYQRWISPHKGFCCAYGALHGSGTCSSIGKSIMREQGMLKFLRLMPAQFGACKTAASVLATETAEEKQARSRALLAKYAVLSDACNLAECACNVRDWGTALHCTPAIKCADCVDKIRACKF